MKTARKQYAEGSSTADMINAGGNALNNILNGVANIKNGTTGAPDTYITNNYGSEQDGSGSKTSTIVIVVAVLIVAALGVFLFVKNK